MFKDNDEADLLALNDLLRPICFRYHATLCNYSIVVAVLSGLLGLLNLLAVTSLMRDEPSPPLGVETTESGHNRSVMRHQDKASYARGTLCSCRQRKVGTP